MMAKTQCPKSKQFKQKETDRQERKRHEIECPNRLLILDHAVVVPFAHCQAVYLCVCVRVFVCVCVCVCVCVYDLHYCNMCCSQREFVLFCLVLGRPVLEYLSPQRECLYWCAIFETTIVSPISVTQLSRLTSYHHF
jgi:hypothetical protein